MEKIITIAILSINILLASGEELPQGLETCHRSDANFNTCLTKTIESGLHFFKNGFPPLKMPPIDPFLINSIQAQHTQGNSNFKLQSSLNKAQLSGLVSLTKITRVATKIGNKFAMKVEAFCDRMEITGGYTMDGQILVLPIKGVGNTNVSMTDVTSLINLRGDLIEKNGETFINLTSFKIKLSPKHTYFFFENIFNGDPALSETINSFMNENWEVVTTTLIPGYEDELGKEFKDIANALYNNVPMKLIYPD